MSCFQYIVSSNNGEYRHHHGFQQLCPDTADTPLSGETVLKHRINHRQGKKAHTVIAVWLTAGSTSHKTKSLLWFPPSG